MITPGQAHDVTAYPALMEEVDDNPEQMLADKGYDSDAVRDDIQKRGGEALIPTRATRKVQHLVDKAIYALRNRIERFFNKIKNSRRVATRYDKLVESFAAFVLLATVRLWIRFVHTTEDIRHRGFDGLISSHCRMGRFSGATRSSMLLGTPGWRRIRPLRSRVTII